jgi:hypothetical protein
MPTPVPEAHGGFFGSRRGFIVISGLAFAGCFLLSEFGRAKHLQWLMGWPPLLFMFTVPAEYRWRFTTGPWLRDVFTAMTTVSWTGLAISSLVEVIVYRVRAVGSPAAPSDLVRLVPIVVLGGMLFGLLSLFSAWGLYSVFYRPEGPAARGRIKTPRQ